MTLTLAHVRPMLGAGIAACGAGLTASEALRKVAGYTGRQCALSACIIGALSVLAWRQQAPEWLALYGTLLAPLLAAGLLAQAARLLPRLGWTSIWSMLLLTILVSAVAALPAYRSVAAVQGFRGLGEPQLLACAIGFASLVLALPLWQLQSHSAALRLASLEKAAVSAELKALQAQIEPHFLYNTLANTRYLVRHDADKASRMLDHLIVYLRSALPDMRGSGSTLDREFELAEHYLALMAIRFGERLTYRLDCPDALKSAAVPPLMLMSLVENAVRHGVEARPGAVHVEIAAREEAGQLVLLVTDAGDERAAAPVPILGSGVGLRNLRARLEAGFGTGASFSLHIADGAPTRAILRLPLELAV